MVAALEHSPQRSRQLKKAGFPQMVIIPEARLQVFELTEAIAKFLQLVFPRALLQVQLRDKGLVIARVTLPWKSRAKVRRSRRGSLQRVPRAGCTSEGSRFLPFWRALFLGVLTTAILD